MKGSRLPWQRLVYLGRRAFLNGDLVPILTGAVIGLAAGGAAIAFRELLSGAGVAFQTLREVPSWPVWIALPLSLGLAGLVVGTISTYFAPEVRGHGVPEVMSAVARRGIVRMRVVLAKSLASALSIGSGASVGREGPIVQIGSAIGSAVGQVLRAPAQDVKAMVGCGAAAGISATFNAPIAGVLFSLEVILRDFRLKAFTPIVCSSVIATTVSRSYFGNSPAFHIPELSIGHPLELAFHFGLGIAAGAVGVLFTRLLYVSEDLADRIDIPQALKAGGGALLVGIIAIEFREVMGVGYEAIESVLNATPHFTVVSLTILLAAKIVATGLTLASGGSGGIFAPSLFMGAAVGGAVGHGLHELLPDLVTQPGAYALVGMGALVAATTHAPLCSIVILFELTDDYKIILPLMLASIVSTITARRLCADSIYTLKLSRRGEKLFLDPVARILAAAQVAEVLSEKPPPTLREDTPLPEILTALKTSPRSDLPVLDGQERFVGIVRFQTLKTILREPELEPIVIARDVCEDHLDPLCQDDSLAEAFHRFRECQAECLAVVVSRESPEFVGLLYRGELINYCGDLVSSEKPVRMNSGPDRGPSVG